MHIVVLDRPLLSSGDYVFVIDIYTVFCETGHSSSDVVSVYRLDMHNVY